jgi:hypothetical protein
MFYDAFALPRHEHPQNGFSFHRINRLSGQLQPFPDFLPQMSRCGRACRNRRQQYPESLPVVRSSGPVPHLLAELVMQMFPGETTRKQAGFHQIEQDGGSDHPFHGGGLV